MNGNAVQKQANKKYRPEVDGIRAFAILAVLINHFNKEILPGGYLGVDIFFVISGYVITSSLSGRPSESFKEFIGGFYERRIKRLIPALSVFVLLTSILVCLFNPSPGNDLLAGTWALFGFSNIHLFGQSVDYFAQSTELNPFAHTCSLGVEEQFYLVFPILLWLSGFNCQGAKGTRNLLILLLSLAAVSLFCFLYLYKPNQSAAYFLMSSRFWEIAAGCLYLLHFKSTAHLKML